MTKHFTCEIPYITSATENAAKPPRSSNVCSPACLLTLLLRSILFLYHFFLQHRYLFCFEFLIFFEIFLLKNVYVCIHMCLNAYGEKKKISSLWVTGVYELLHMGVRIRKPNPHDRPASSGNCWAISPVPLFVSSNPEVN